MLSRQSGVECSSFNFVLLDNPRRRSKVWCEKQCMNLTGHAHRLAAPESIKALECFVRAAGGPKALFWTGLREVDDHLVNIYAKNESKGEIDEDDDRDVDDIDPNLDQEVAYYKDRSHVYAKEWNLVPDTGTFKNLQGEPIKCGCDTGWSKLSLWKKL